MSNGSPLMLRNILFCTLVLSTASSARADFVDFFNGVTVGAQLPKHDLAFIGPAPATENKVQLIDFWATWCAPCITSIPKFNAFHQKFALKGLVIIGVSQESREVVEPFLTKVPMQYASALEGKAKLHVALKIKALPYAIFVDRAGKIVWRGQPSAISEELIESLLAPSAPSGG